MGQCSLEVKLPITLSGAGELIKFQYRFFIGAK
jgi:hypothetical protein